MLRKWIKLVIDILSLSVAVPLSGSKIPRPDITKSRKSLQGKLRYFPAEYEEPSSDKRRSFGFHKLKEGKTNLVNVKLPSLI